MQHVCTDAEMMALLARARQGDSAAYDRLYDLYADKVFRYLYARLGQCQAAEDLTSDVFVRLIQTLPRFKTNADRPVASFSAWLYRIAGNLLTDYYRKQKHRAHDDIDDHFHLVDGQPDPYQHSVTMDQERALTAAIAKLAEEQQMVVIHRFAEGRSLAEVAELMGKTVGAIKALQHRAVENLRRILPQGILD